MIINENKSFKIRNDMIRYHSSGKSIGLLIKRSNGIILPNPEWFPLSQLKITEYSIYTKIEIPEWLLNKKLLSGYSIAED